MTTTVKYIPSWVDRAIGFAALALVCWLLVQIGAQQQAILTSQTTIDKAMTDVSESLQRAEKDRLEALRLLHNLAAPPEK